MFETLATFAIFGSTILSQLGGTSGEAIIDSIKTKNEKEIRGIYMTAHTAGYKERREALVRFVQNTELNAVVIDVKDSTGRIFFKTHVPLAEKINSENLKVTPDLADFVKKLKEKNIYTIARIVVFQDPYLAEKLPQFSLKNKKQQIWRDRKGLPWIDPTLSIIWKYNIDIAHSAVLLGFDEINFDYIRFPTDGDIKDIVYPFFDESREKKTDIMAQFFYYLFESFRNYPVYVSVDLFGITLWRSDGVDIGQRYQDAAHYVDYIAPMVYPSHYPDGFEGYENPAEYPYEIISRSLGKTKKFMMGKRARIRPWLQDFDLGANYDTEKIKAQIRAVKDGGGFGWILWNSSNRYTQEAFN